MTELKKIVYKSVQGSYCEITEQFYKRYQGIRLTDSQLCKLFTSEYEGKYATHMSRIRRTRCNDSNQPYVDANFIDGKWVKNK
jgi:hypothetical protein